jgi:hypothetical protein
MRDALAIYLGLFLVSPAVAQEGAYLFDLLKQQPYLESWNAMLSHERVEPWLSRYAKSKDGPASPSKSINLDGEAYLLTNVCKTHDCGDNMFYVVFAPHGTHAWGLLLTNQSNEKWVGNPSGRIRDVLKGATKG